MGLGPGPDLFVQGRDRVGVGKEPLSIRGSDLSPPHVDVVLSASPAWARPAQSMRTRRCSSMASGGVGRVPDGDEVVGEGHRASIDLLVVVVVARAATDPAGRVLGVVLPQLGLRVLQHVDAQLVGQADSSPEPILVVPAEHLRVRPRRRWLRHPYPASVQLAVVLPVVEVLLQPSAGNNVVLGCDRL